MANVSLRIYNQEIEGLVESGQLDEAIAHCRHILNTFPKHLETYRMIGKAYLEAKRYDEATDIFERLLMAVPDDFVANVGMSIIRDEQNSMDAAIWHMQRAFEVQPSNAAIQSELQRLYGRRDGVEPPKIRLTRGALAHMYVQGELYPQAISEINGVLEEDPERQDMQVLLARAYFHAGQKSEAAEMCSQLLRRYPYCFDANRVLVELLPQTEQGESVQTYRKRINEMNPYTAFVTGSVFHTEEVPDGAVSLERLEWDGQPVDIGSEWGETQGIGLGETPAAGEQEPDWLKTDLTSGSFGDSTSTDEPASASEGLPVPTPGGEDQIPEFLRDAGWGEDTGTFQEGQASFVDSDESSDDIPLAEGDLPDWVKAMAPEGADAEPPAPQVEPEDDLTQDDVPDWLQGIGDAQGSLSDEQPLESGDIPDWLAAAEPTEEETSAPETSPAPQPQEQPVAEPTSDDDIPDWLESVQNEEEQAVSQEPAQEMTQEPISEPDEEPAMTSDESLSDWQIDEEETEGPVDFDKTDTGELGTSANEQEDAIAWLEGLASKHGAKAEELVTDPNARSETEPDWVQRAKATKEQGGAEVPVSQDGPPAEPPVDLPDFLSKEAAEPSEEITPEADLPDFLSEGAAEIAAEAGAADVDDLGTSAEEQDDAVAWLESLASKHGAKPEELVTDPSKRSESEPDWVQKAKASQEQPSTAEEPVSKERPPAETSDDIPDWLAEEQAEPDEELTPQVDEPSLEEQPPVETGSADISDLGVTAEEQDDAVAWLEGLASKHGAKPEELVTDPEARKDSAPDWVQKASEAGSGQGVGERPTAPPPEELVEEDQEIPDQAMQADESLYAGMEDAQTKEPVSTADDADETGMWLQELGEEAGAAEERQEPVSEAETPAAEDDVPDWLREMEGAASQTEAASTPGDEASLPDWLRDMDSGPSEAEEVPAQASEEAVSEPAPEPESFEKVDINAAPIEELAELPGIGDLLAQNIVAYRETYGDFSNLDDLSKIAGIGPSTIDDLRGRVEIEAQPDITDWLKSVDAEEAGEPVSELTEEAPADDLPAWLSGLDEESEQSQPSDASDDDLPGWLRAEAEGEPVQPKPTEPSDWKPADAEEPAPEPEPEKDVQEPASEPESEVEEQPAPGAPPPTPESETEGSPVQSAPPPASEPEPKPEPEEEPEEPPPGRPAYQEPVTRSRTGMTGMLSPAQDPALTAAQNELTRGNIPSAMENYGKLIKKGKLLEEIVFDLREALYRYPVEVIILQTLGDAYMRGNRLQEALDAYTKAEELLR